MRLLLISGSLRRESHNSALVRAAAETLPPGWEPEVYDGLAGLPHYSEDLDTESPPQAVRELREAIGGADALLVATPEYNASIPGVLKNAIDWASRPFPGNSLRDKPVAVVGASTGLFGAIWAQAELRKVLEHTGADVLVGHRDGQLGLEDVGARVLEQREALANLTGALLAAVPEPALAG